MRGRKKDTEMSTEKMKMIELTFLTKGGKDEH